MNENEKNGVNFTLSNNIDKEKKNDEHPNKEIETLDVSYVKEDEIDEAEKIPLNVRTRIFLMFLLANGFLNYDTGVIPASLLEIEKEIKLSYKEQALIGSLVYLGLSFASIFCSSLFRKFGASKVCSIMMLLNSICCFIFSFSNNKMILFSCRFIMGVTEAFIVIYGPVWVNNYSPQEHSTKWMGILHTFSALGVILGYIIAGVVINTFGSSWRYAIQVQGIAEIPIFLYFWFENEQYINLDLNPPKKEENLDLSIVKNHKKSSQNLSTINSNKLKSKTKGKDEISVSVHKGSVNRKNTSNFKRSETRIDAVQTSNISLYCKQTAEVLCNSIYLWVCFGLCSMFFIVTGIQF